MRLSKQECWVAAWAKVGVKSSGNISAEIAERTCQVNGAERDAVAYLLGEAERYCILGHVDGAVDRLELAAAMVAQRGRVLGALRAARAVEEVLSDPKNDLRRDGNVLVEIKGAMSDHGFGPWSPKAGGAS